MVHVSWLSPVVAWVSVVGASVCARHWHVSAAAAMSSCRHKCALLPQVLRPGEAAAATGAEQCKDAVRSGPGQLLPHRGATASADIKAALAAALAASAGR